MPPMRGKPSERAGRAGAGGFPEQAPPTSRKTKADGPGDEEGYLRLRVRVENGELSLAGATFVEGPLIQSTVLHPGLAYEVTLGNRRLAVGEMPDAGVWRSFPDPSGRPALQGHHITVVPSYEVAVRVPMRDVSLAALRRANITLYRWQGGESREPRERTLKTQLGSRVQTIGSLKGIRVDRLPKPAQSRLRQALRRK